jgi:hypothetical protein
MIWIFIGYGIGFYQISALRDLIRRIFDLDKNLYL